MTVFEDSDVASPDPVHAADPLRIAMVVPALYAGGMEVMVIGLSKQLQARGHAVRIFCTEELGAFEYRARQANLDVTLVPAPGAKALLWPAALARALRDGRFDVMHAHSGVSAKAVRAARMAGVRGIVNTLHGYAPPLPPVDLLTMLSAAAQTHINVGCSDNTVAFYDGWFPWRRGRTALVKNGIDLDAFEAGDATSSLRSELGIAADASVLGTVGRLEPVKNQQLLVDAMALLPSHWHLVLVGEGPLRSSLLERAASLGLSQRVHLAGRRGVTAALYQQFDVFALSSVSEAMPMTILEAFAAGVPVVAPAVGGIPSLLADGQLGRLFTSGDPAALAAAVTAVHTDAATTNVQLARARDVVTTSHSLPAMCAAYEAVYRRALAIGGGRRPS